MTTHDDNPAGRLLTVIRTAKSQPDTPALVGWARLFGIDAPETPGGQGEVIRRLVELHRLIDDLETKILTIEDEEERDAFLRPLPTFRRAIPVINVNSQNLHPPLDALTESDLTILEFCSRYLHRNGAEVVADAELLRKLAKDIERLFGKIAGSTELDPALKRFLLRQLEELRRGIQEYRIGGIERLKESLGSVVGAVIVNQDTVQDQQEIDEVKEFLEVTSTLMSITKFAWKATKTIESVKSVLPLLLSGHR